jgi:uncharacterized membrane protein
MIYLLALILRLPIMTSSLWLDESIQALALMGKMGPLLTYALSDFQPPIYHLILSAWTSLVGFSEFALRTPSLLAGLGTVYFGRKLASALNKKAGTIAGLLLATNPLLIYYSAEGRTYMMTTFFVTASFYYLLSLLVSQKRHKLLAICYMLSTMFALWSSYLAWIIIFFQLAYVVSQKKWQLTRLAFLTFLSLIPWLPSLIDSIGIGLSTMSHSPEWGRVVGGISGKAIALTWVKAVIGRISFTNKYLYAGIIALIAALHSHILTRVKGKYTLLTVSIIGTVLFASLISLVVPIYSYFRLLFLVPLLLTLLALGLSKLPRTVTVLMVVLNLVFVGIFYLSPAFHHEDWRSLTSYLNSQDGIVALPSLAQNAPLRYYNLHLPLTELKNQELLTTDRVFYIKYVEDIFDTSLQGRANLAEQGYNLVSEQTYSGLALSIYEK